MTGHDGGPLRLTVAGRTDRGVHAWGQVASYPHEAVDPLRLNSLLDDDVAVLAAEPAQAVFDARRDATQQDLLLPRARATHPQRVRAQAAPSGGPERLDREALAEVRARSSAGTTSRPSRPARPSTRYFRCEVTSAEWRADGDLLEFWIEADMFLRHMNRVLVGTMLDVAGGQANARGIRGAA